MNWTDVVFWSAMLFLMFASTVLSTQYTVEYPNATTAILYDGSTPYAQVELKNHVSNIGGKLRFNDCDLFDCKVKIAITPFTNIKLNNENEIRGWFDYNKKEVSYDGAELYTGAWAAYYGKMTLVAGTEYLFGLNYHKEDLRDSVDLIPSVFGADITEWAWWNSTFPYRVGYNISSAGAVNLTDFQQQFILDLNETITNGTSLRATWLNPSTALEEEIPFWRSVGMFYNDTTWSYTNANGSVWAKVPSIPVGTNTSEVYFYYTDFTGLEDKSNAENVFLFYEPCNNVSKWSGNVSGTFAAASGYCYFSAMAGGASYSRILASNLTVPTNAVIESAMYAGAGQYNASFVFLNTTSTYSNGYQLFMINYSTPADGLLKTLATGIASVSPTHTAALTWYSWVWLIDADTPRMTVLRNGSDAPTTADSTYSYGGTLGITSQANPLSFARWDDIRVRKGAVVFPTSSTQGTEEYNGAALYAATACGSYDTLATFYFIDEQSNANTTANTTIEIAASGIGGGNFSITSAQSFRICKPTYAPNFTANITIDYWNNTAGVRNYYLAATNSTNTTIMLYMLENTYSSAVQFITKNQFGNPLANRVQHYLRYFPANSTYQLVAMGQTADDGTYVANIFTNGTTFYKIISFGTDGTTIEKTWNAESVYCIAGQSCTYTLTIDSGVTLPEYWTDVYNKVTYNCSYNNGTKTVACTYADGSGVSHSYNLTARRLGWGNPVQVCTTTSSAASGTLLCIINDTNTSGSIYSWELRHQSEPLLISSGMLDFRDISFKWVAMGLAMLIILTFGLIGLFNPVIGFILVPIGIAVASWLQFIDIPVGIIAGLVLMGAILARKAGGG